MNLKDFMLMNKHSGRTEAEVKESWLSMPDREDVDDDTLNTALADYVANMTTRASKEEKEKAERYNSVESRLDRLEAAVKKLNAKKGVNQ